MAERRLARLFAPRAIALAGASAREGSIGHAVLKNLRDAGFPGKIYAVNPRHAEVDGLECFPSFHDLPAVPDLAVVCAPKEHVPELVEDAAAKGARVMAGGKRGNAGYFFQPTLLADVPDSAEIMNNEPFGPVAVAAPFSTLEDAVAKANRLPYGLAAFAFTEGLRTANLLGDAVEAGMVGINTFAISAADAPFGGVKDSGFGSEGGIEGMDSYLVTKAIHMA